METTPLLLNNESSSPLSLPAVPEEDYLPAAFQTFKEFIKTVFWKETVKLWRIAGPIALSLVCQNGTNILTSIFVGHLGNLELSAVSVSLSVIITFCFGFLLGMGSALETLCGQAFGAGQVHMLGIYLQRSCIILLVTCVILLPIFIFAAPLLKVLGQEAALAELAGKFTLLAIPNLFSWAIYFPTQKFLQAQRKVGVITWIAVVALVLHALWLWLFIYEFGWGITGAAIAFNLTGWLIALAQAVYVVGWCKEGWRGFSWLAFKDIWSFVTLSIASAVMLCLEIWYMMSIVILTGHLDNAVIAVGSLTICLNINGLELMLFLGINAAISVRVSNELGLGHPRAAKYSVYVTVFQSLVIGLVCMAVVLIAKDYFAYIFTSSKVMQVATSKLAFILAITMVLNSVQPVISGVAIGGGWQALVAYINIGCYYVFGLPLGYLLGYTANLGVEGVWGGMLGGTALQTLLLLIILYKTNWKKEVAQTAERMKRWGGDGQDIDTDRKVEEINYS
ncbi:PREDICTED: protein TRANSPARENT TESTA 12-like [Populus euphratica]|uniref:Protein DETOXIFICATION n=1 Tax=Populus euphratica TaxID=75702 RepID=A0AAJ6VKF3_POPEU|nr:PREDICTED: protein TRANSPARENT TESTA 12-like [Populus euphratica]